MILLIYVVFNLPKFSIDVLNDLKPVVKILPNIYVLLKNIYTYIYVCLAAAVAE